MGTAINALTPTSANVGSLGYSNNLVSISTTGLPKAPASLAVDGSGNVYEAENTSTQLYKVTPGGARTALLRCFQSIFSMAADASGNVYVADGTAGVAEVPAGGEPVTLGSGIGEGS